MNGLANGICYRLVAVRKLGGKVGLKQTKKLSVSLKSLGSDGDSPDSAAGGTSLQHSGISIHHPAVAEVLSMAHLDDQDCCLVRFQVCSSG